MDKNLPGCDNLNDVLKYHGINYTTVNNTVEVCQADYNFTINEKDYEELKDQLLKCFTPKKES